MSRFIDGTPSPNSLRLYKHMDITLEQSLYELIDNAIDSFDFNKEIEPKITITFPAKKAEDLTINDKITIEDNGCGMTESVLSYAVKVGYTSNDTFENREKLGLYGIGFNIATAKLGSNTVIETKAENEPAVKLTIDFYNLIKNQTFKFPVEDIDKKAIGTIITISELNKDIIGNTWRNRSKIAERIGRTYSSIIKKRNLKIFFGDELCQPYRHFTWSRTREGFSATFKENIPAIIDIDKVLDIKKYCDPCRLWLDENQIECPSCKSSLNIEQRERKVTGWIGLQCHFEDEEYGFDIIRNGRMILKNDKQLFYWRNEKTQEDEKEYPIDGFDGRGRFVGELDFDFCEVSFTKDNFEETYNFALAKEAVRGTSPIRPDIAKRYGLPRNESPLAKLFSAFRSIKATPQNLIPRSSKNGNSALLKGMIIDELKQKFHANVHGYNTDSKYWELIINDGTLTSDKKDDSEPDPLNNPFGEDNNEPVDPFQPMTVIDEIDELILKSIIDEDLTKVYELPIFENTKIKVNAYLNENEDFEDGFKWQPKGNEANFVITKNSDIYRKTSLVPEDFLINELAYQFHTSAVNDIKTNSFSKIEREIRLKYFPKLQPEGEEINKQIERLTRDLRDYLKDKMNTIVDFDLNKFEEISIKKIITEIMKIDSITEKEARDKATNGDFVKFGNISDICQLIKFYPISVFNGEFFKGNYTETDAHIDNPYIKETLSCLDDIVWFTETQPNTTPYWYARYKRTIGAIKILEDRRS